MVHRHTKGVTAMATVGYQAGSPPHAHRPALSRLWNRQLEHYPERAARYASLAIVVLATVALYYQLYIAGAVATRIIGGLGMSFLFYVNIIVVGNALGAFASLAAGAADRWGRANLVVAGLLAVGVLAAVGVPNTHTKWSFAVVFGALSLVEGVLLVATPALVRDFSPQLGRASAMGFWTLGPVLGSLVVSAVSSNTLSHLGAWQDQFVIAGVAGLAVGLLALAGLRELSPQLRDQLMVSLDDRALIEARARGLDVEQAIARPWRQMLHLDVVVPALAISVFLILYVTAVVFFPAYFQTIFGFSSSDANALGNWYWAFDAGALLAVGLLSDRVLVRKPFMAVGAVGTVVFTVLFLLRATHPHTGYYTLAGLLVGIGICQGLTYAPWMAAFTETVERHNPALTATGLAVWGWIIRVVAALALLIVPHVITTMTPLVTDGPAVRAAAARQAPVLAAVQAHPDVIARIQQINASEGDVVRAVQAHLPLVLQLSRYPDPAQIPPALLAQASAQLGPTVLLKLSDPKVQADLRFLQVQAPTVLGPATFAALADPKVQADLALLRVTGPRVQSAAARSPRQWRTWFWVCAGGEVLFLPGIALLSGRWDPRRARRDAEEHEALIAAQLAQLGA